MAQPIGWTVAVEDVPGSEEVGAFDHEERGVEAAEDAGDGEGQAEARGAPVKDTSGEDEEAIRPPPSAAVNDCEAAAPEDR
jgi:hypothetical protein